MRIVVSAAGPSLDAEVDPRFGRCSYLVFVNPETMEFEAAENPNIGSPSGAGIATAQMAVNKGIEAAVTGSVGPNAAQILAAAGVPVVTFAGGSVREAVEGYKAGSLRPASQPTAGTPPGMGGMGRGMGQMGGMGQGVMPGQAPQPSVPAGQEVEELNQAARAMRRQLEEIERRLKELESKEQ